MKAFKRGLSVFLAVLLMIGTIPTVAMAEFKSAVIGEEVSLQNDFIKATVNSKNGRFSIQTVEGQPERKKDQNTFLTFLGGLFGKDEYGNYRGDSDTSFTTFRINGTDYIFGNKYSFEVGEGVSKKTLTSELGNTTVIKSGDPGVDIPDGCQAVITPWSIEGVEILQILLLFPDTADATTGKMDDNSGNVEIYYQIKNNSGAEVKVGARLLLDTMVGANDGPEFQIGTISANTLKVERMLSPNPVTDQNVAAENTNYWTMPGYWVMKDTLDPSNPLATNVIGYGYTNIAGMRDLDYMIVSHWNKLANEKYEEFDDYKAVPPELEELTSEASRTQRLAELAAELAERKLTEKNLKAEAAQGAEVGSKAQQDAQKAAEEYQKVKDASDKAAAAAATAMAKLDEARGSRAQKGSSIIDPNLDFTNDLNDYGSADSAVAFFWSGEGEAAKIAAGKTMSIGTVYGLGEIIDPTSVLSITFPDPVTQVDVDPNDPNEKYKNDGVFDINVEVENLASYHMNHSSFEITMELEKGLRFVKLDAQGNILLDENGVPLTSYSSTKTITYEKPLTPEQAEKGERNYIGPGEKIGATFKVVAQGKPWPTTRQYMVTATSPELELEFEDKYGNTSEDDVKALYNASRANFVFLPSIGSGTPTYATSVSPEECFTKDPKYITVNLTNVEAYNPGSSVRGQEANPNFNLFFEEIVTGKRYQIDVTDNVQCIVTDDGLTGDMRISYTNGTLVDADGIVLETDLGCALPVGEYRIEVDYISTDDDENAVLDLVTDQTFLVTENEEARIREPAILAVVKETVDFDDQGLMDKINALVQEVQNAIEELQKIAEKFENLDGDAIYDEVIDFAKELINPVTQIYDSLEKLTDFSNIESEMRELSKSYDELADVDFSSIKNFDVGKAIKGVNVSVDLSDAFKEQLSIDSLLLGPLGLSGMMDNMSGDGVEGVFQSILGKGKEILKPVTDIYDDIASLGDFSSLSDADIATLKSSCAALQNVDFSFLKDASFKLSVDLSASGEAALKAKLNDIIGFDISQLPFLDDGDNSNGNSTDGLSFIYNALLSYSEDAIKPIMNLYDDVVELADFSGIEKDWDELVKAFPELADVDFSCLKDFDFAEALTGVADSVSVDVALSDKFKEVFDYETILAGPFANSDGKDAIDVFADRVIAYGKKTISPLTSIYDEIEDLADFSNIESEMEGLSKNFKELEGVDFSCLADFEIAAAIKAVTNSASVDVDLTSKFKEKFHYDDIVKGPVDANGNFDTNKLESWLGYVNGAVNEGKKFYELGKNAYDSKSVKTYAQTLVTLYNELLGVNISVDFSAALTEANKTAASQTWDNSKKLALAFMAMYAKMQNIYSDLSDRYGKATDLYQQVNDIKDEVVSFVRAIGNGDYNKLLSLGTDMVEFVLGEWLNPVKTAVNSAKDVYEIGKKAYDGKLSVKEGAQLMMDFYEKYLDVNVKVDWTAVGDKNIEAGAKTYSEAQKMAAAFMVMYARMQNIYSSISKKVDRATDVYDQAREIVETVVDLVGAIGNTSPSEFAEALLTKGTDVVSKVIDAWIAQVEEAINSVKEIYEIALHSYRGDLSMEEGAQMLIDFYETYLDVSVKADLDVEGAKNQAQKVGAAFMVMYAQMKNVYNDVNTCVETAQKVYHNVTTIISTVIKLVNDPLAALNDLVNIGQDAIYDILNAYLDKINEMVDSVKDIYEIGKRAYQGDIDIKEGAELLIGFYEKYLNVSISADLDAVGEENRKAASDTYEQGKKMALAFMAMFARMKNIYSSMSSKYNEMTDVYDQMKSIVDTVTKLFTDPASGAFALMDLVKEKIMDKLDGLGMYKDMFLQMLDVIENFDDFDPSDLVDEAMNYAVTVARVKADQALYSEIYGALVTAATALDPNSDYDWDPSEMKPSLPTYRLMTFGDESELKEYQDKVAVQNKAKKEAAAKDKTGDEAKKAAAAVGNDGVMVKITGMIRQLGEGENVTDYIVDTSSEPAIINETVAFKGSDLVFTQGKLKISFGDIATIDAGEYISKAQSLYGSETPLFDTLIVSGSGDLYIEGSGFVFHQGEWSLDFYNGFDKILDPEPLDENGNRQQKDAKENSSSESDALNETAAWAIGALNDMFNPLKALAITDVYFNRHTLFSAPSFSVAGFGLKFDNYLLHSNEVCFGGHIDFKIVTGEIQNVFFNSSGLQSIEADLKFGLPEDLGLLQKGESVGGNLHIHYYDQDYVQYIRDHYNANFDPNEIYGLDFSAQLKKIGGVGVELSFKRVADGRILPDVIGFQATPPAPGILVTGGTYLTQLRGAIKELADTIAGGSSTVPLTIEAGVDIKFGQDPATFDGKIDMILKMTGIEFNGSMKFKGKPMVTQAQIKAQWVTPWFVSASMEMDVLGLNVIIGNARIFIGQNLEKNRIDFEGFVSAALQIPESVAVVGGMQLGKVSFGLNNDKIWGSASVGVDPICVGVGITYYWGGGIEFNTDGEDLPEAYSYLLVERPEEEPVLLAIGSGMRTEATSWVNENTIHAIELHAIEDGLSYIDNGQNDIGIGRIEVSNEGKNHVIPVGTVGDDRDALIEIEYYGDDVPTFTVNSPYSIKICDDMATAPKDSGYNAFKQELKTVDGVNRHLVYVLVPHSSINGNFTLTSSERVQTKLLSTPIAPSIGSVTLAEGDDGSSTTDYKAVVTVANAHAGDTVSLYLTTETVGTGVEYVTTKDGDKIPVTEDNDPGVTIFENIPVENGSVTQAFDLTSISGTYAVDGLGDIRELLESGNYYLRAALKSDTAYDAKTSDNAIELADPKAPAPATEAALANAGNGYFDLSFTKSDDAESYRVDFYEKKGDKLLLWENYNGLVFDAADIAENLSGGTYTLRIGGWSMSSWDEMVIDEETGEETDMVKQVHTSYSGLKTGNTYVAKVYAAKQTSDENYHYAAPSASAATLLPETQYVSFTSITSDGKTLGLKKIKDGSGNEITTSSRELVTNQTMPELTLVTNIPTATVEAYNGDEKVGVMADGGKLKLSGLTTDGDYMVELHATNTATGDLSVAIVYVTIDTQRPTLFVTSPGSISGRSVSFSSFDLTGVTEPGSTVKANGKSITVAKDGSFNDKMTLNNSLAKGEVTLIVTDKAGNSNKAVVPVTNSNYQAPIGINVVRTGTMKTDETQAAQVFLRYADGKNNDGTQKYKSVELSEEEKSNVTFEVVRGEAVSVNNRGTISAVQEGASLLKASYKVNDKLSLDTAIAILVEGKNDSGSGSDSGGSDIGGDSGGGSGSGSSGGVGGGGAAAGGGGAAGVTSTADIVINDKSSTVTTDETGTSAIQVSASDSIDTTKTLTVKNTATDADVYVLNVAADVAKELSGETGEGVRFTAGETQIELPGETLTGSAISITISEPSAAEQARSSTVAQQLGSSVVTSGSTITVTGAKIEPGDKVITQLEIPAGVNVSDITAMVYIDENGEYTNLPWKLTVAGNTAYVKTILPGSGTIVPLSNTTTFNDVSAGYWGASAIEDAAQQMLIRGYEDGTFKPESNVTRSEFTTIALRSGGLMTAPKALISYLDIGKSDWSYNAISIATGLGIIKGSDGYVRPNSNITRAEGMAITSRLLKLEKVVGEVTDAETDRILSGFSDDKSLPAWARKEIALCVKSGIINGIDGAIKPNDALTRVQAALIATRLSAAIAKTM